MKLLLYGTRSCHLCEEAEALVHACRVGADYVDIADDDALLERYGMRIPVLRRADTGAELDWPFDHATLQRFLAQDQW